MADSAYEYIIIGSGSAGSLVANRLSADPDATVLVLESGGWDRIFWLKLPVGYFRSIYDARFSRVFNTEPSEGDGQRGIGWPRGHVVGGSSSINGLVFIRGQQEDYNDWVKLGATHWSYDEVLPHFKALENYQGGDDHYRGRGGGSWLSPIYATRIRRVPPGFKQRKSLVCPLTVILMVQLHLVLARISCLLPNDLEPVLHRRF